MKTNIDRREFLRSTAAIGAALYVSGDAVGQGTAGKSDDINVALLGAGEQGRTLMGAIMEMDDPSIRFKAVCDIWPYNRNWVSKRLKAYKHPNNAYEGYEEMLDKEKDLDAVLIATPDFWHADHAAGCLQAGLHVYCEKEMSNTVEGARKIVEAARQSGKLLQIGHQRRSNPRYIYCYEKLIKEAKLLNHITTVNGQWNRSRRACEELGWPRGSDIDDAMLKNYGFESMKQFRNWRWYKGLGGGPIVDLGSHQIDIYTWFLGANPKSVMASGGRDYWTGHQWYDNVMAIFEYETEQGTVRAFYQTLTTNSSQGYFEQFMGDEGTLVISETAGRGAIYREHWVEETKWAPWVKKGYIKQTAGLKQPKKPAVAGDLRESPTPPKYDLPVTLLGAFHRPHLENFFDAIRGKAKLNCPVEVGYETAVSVLKVNEAIEAGRRLEFKPEEFKV
jgi:predicted dehydrogenase